jgi:hypothetical protein
LDEGELSFRGPGGETDRGGGELLDRHAPSSGEFRDRQLLGEEKLDLEAASRLSSLLELGDPNAEVAIAYRIKERLRDF